VLITFIHIHSVVGYNYWRALFPLVQGASDCGIRTGFSFKAFVYRSGGICVLLITFIDLDSIIG
jgi:hypothetical protein